MIYKIKYNYDNGYQHLIMTAVVSSNITLSTDKEVKDFLNKYIYTRSEEFVKEIYDWDQIDFESAENKIILNKIGV